MSESQALEPSAPSMTRRRVVREMALTVGALAGLGCVLVALAAFLFGITPLVFRSGSMSPAIETGALALSRETPAKDVKVGDVVNVTNAAGNGITHRVIEIGAVGGDSVELLLQGDANAQPDAEPYVVSDVGRIFFSVPKLGYAVTWLSGPVAVFAGGVLVGVLLMIAWKPRGRNDTEAVAGDDARSAGKHGKLPMSVFVALATIGAVGIATSNPPTALAAPPFDTAVATSGTISTVVPTPASFSCTNPTLGSAQLSWPNNPAYGYELTINPPTGITSPVVLSPATGTTRTWNTIQVATLLFTGTRTFTLRATVNGFVSPPTGTRTVQFVGLLLPSCTTTGPAGASARLAPQSQDPSSTPPPASSEAPSTSVDIPTTTTTPAEPAPEPPAATEPPQAVEPTPEPTTTTPPAPVDLISPQSSPSGSAVAKVVSVDGSPTLQITDSSGAVQYSGPVSSSSEYGYGVAWASGDQLWLLGPGQLVRLDSTGSGWTRSVVDPTDSDQIPTEIAAQLN